MFKVSTSASPTRLEDLALPADRVTRLRLVAAQRAAGTVLVTGLSSAQRTLAAEAVAGSMGRQLLHVDLARIVSKFIGETEKNLSRVFATAAASGAVLFFDEADALFGKRSTVRDSHDRYANVEVAYLLQRLESHPLLVILASGTRQAIDPAVLRRLRHVIELPWPPKRA